MLNYNYIVFMLFALFFGLPSVNISDFGKKRKTRQG